jgi:hypothetical protein
MEVREIKARYRVMGEITKDAKNRITLTKAALPKEIKRFKMLKSDDGNVLLQPLVEVPISEKWLYENKDALMSVMRGLEDSAKGRVRKRNENKS